MKKIHFILMIILSSNTIGAQHTIMLDSGYIINGNHSSKPYRDIEEVSDGTIITYRLNNASIINDPLFPTASIINIGGFGTNRMIGIPSTLLRWDSFAIPKGMSYDVAIFDSAFIDVPMELSPSRQPIFRTDSINDSIDSSPIVPYMGLYPHNIISTTQLSNYKGIDILNICINPVKYNYWDRYVRFFTKISYKVTYVTVSDVNNTSSDSTCQAYDSFIANLTLNGNRFRNQEQLRAFPYDGNENTPFYYIVTVPKYLKPVNDFAEWKRMLGFKVVLLVDNNWTVAKIKDSLRYTNAENYLLIVGDHEDVPAELNTIGSHSFYSDNGYIYGRDNNKIPSIYSGRIPVSTLEEATIAIDKIINYERNPVDDSSFYDTGVNISFFEDDDLDGYDNRRFVFTSERIRNYLLDKHKTINRVYNKTDGSTPMYWHLADGHGNQIPDSLQIGYFNWNGTSDNISQLINNGAFYVMYNGHGGILGWTKPFYDVFYVDEGLNNSPKYPLVISLTCHTGTFTDSQECLIERMIRSHHGCIGAFAHTTFGYSNDNEALEESIFDTLWPEPGLISSFNSNSNTNYFYTYIPEYRLGKLLAQSMHKAKAICGSLIITPVSTHCFGDPSMRIYTVKPTPINDVTIIREPGELTVSFDSNLHDDATLSFYDRSDGSIATYERTTQKTVLTNPDSTVVCISAPNKYLFIDDPCKTRYIQNETIQGTQHIRSNTILVGSEVTDNKPHGEVRFIGGKVTLVGKEIILNGQTTIERGTEFEICNQ